MSNKQNQTKGFTIIEVVLVLAIAALIFLLVFLALPALQRSRRDTQRRDDMSRVLSQVQTWQANNNGQVPASQSEVDTLKSTYLQAGGDTFSDPTTGSVYTMTYMTGAKAATTFSTVGTIYYVKGATCAAGGATTSGSGNQVAVATKLEGSGVYCVDNG